LAVVLLAWAVASGSVTAVAQPFDPADRVLEADRLLEELELDRALALIQEHEQEQPGSAETAYLQSRYLFMVGEYELALEYADRALAQSDSPPGYMWAHRNLVEATLNEVADFAEHVTRGGHFVIRYDPDRDAVLVPYAEEALEGAYAEVGFDFGYWPQEPVRVEIYPRTASLANVSSLTEEQIHNSGTIALCKYNRLMITSPRALVRGYTWQDTLAHEYVHLVIQHLTGTRVPIWLHEGLAKFEEQRWRGSFERHLPPSNEDLLARRVEAEDLITFEQMHPSMALLPTQEDAGTAFAEVFTVVEYIYRQYGVEGLRELVWAIRDGAEVEDALAAVTGQRFEVFLANWERHLESREFNRLPSDFRMALQFMPDEASEAPPDELEGIAEEEARDFMHLGQLLRGRGRVAASIVEYRKAESLVGTDNPVLQNWLARALLDSGQPEAAVEALGDAARYYPEFYLTFLHLGEAHLRLSEPEAALPLLEQAVGINPFDPEVHRQLSRAFERLGDAEEAERARRDAQMVAH
jgi:tetratricopeptide (TPR) repeat protein